MSKTPFLKIAAACWLCSPSAWGQIITTVAGTDWFFPTTSLPAVNMPLGTTSDVTVDSKGNVYIPDRDNGLVLRLSGGVLTVLAGNGSALSSGDGGPATDAGMHPEGIAIDSSGNLYITDLLNSRVRKVTTNGTITTVAGNGVAGFSGDGGPAINAELNTPNGVAVDSSGNLYITDTYNNRLRKVTPAGIISTIAGNGILGFSGDGGLATLAELAQPTSVKMDPSGNIYFTDALNLRIRKITPTGMISTIAGSGSVGFSGDGGPATSASLALPFGLALDAAGNLYIADALNNRIRKISTSGIITTVAGSGQRGFAGDGGPATSALLGRPHGVAVDSTGNLYIADGDQGRIRRVTTAGIISTVAGNGNFRYSGDGGPALRTVLNSPQAMIFNSRGELLFTDTLNNRIRDLLPDGTITSLGGNGSLGYAGDGGPATKATLFFPEGLTLDYYGNGYIADTSNCLVRKVAPDGTISTLAGLTNTVTPCGYSGDNGPANRAALNYPLGLVADTSGYVYISDTDNNRIRAVGPNGTILTVAGNGTAGYTGDGFSSTQASINLPGGMVLDTGGNLYFADSGNNVIRRVSTSLIINTVAGTGVAGFSGDGGQSLSARLNAPSSVAGDALGNLYIADTGNHRIRKVTPSGIISTVAGTGTPGFSGDGGLAVNARLNTPIGVAVDASGDLYIGDTGNNRIRKIIPQTSVTFRASPLTLAFSATAGASPAPAQSVSLTPSLSGIAFTATSSVPWLTVTPPSGAMPSALRVFADPSTLAAGTYKGSIAISAANASTSAVNVNVTFTVQPSTPPLLNVASQSLSFTAFQNSAPQTAQIQVQNSGAGTLNFSATAAISSTSTANWLSISPATGSARPASPGSLTVTATPGSLIPGTYQGTVTITGAGATATVKVALSITAPNAQILVSQSGLSFTAVSQGGSPLPQSFWILNVGQGSMSWTASATTLSGGSKWLQISPSTGTVVQPYLDVSQVNVSIDPTGLTQGDYYGRIQVSAPASNSPQLVTVILTVLPPGVSPGPEVRPSALVFTGVAGSTPGSQDVMLGNPMPTADSFNSVALTTANAFTYLPATAQVPSSQPTTLRVFPDFSKVQPGTIDHGAITLVFSDGTPRTVTVLTVVAPAQTSSSRLSPQASGCSSPKLEIQLRAPASQQSFAATIGNPSNIEVQVVDDCGNLIGPTNPASASVIATFSNKDADLHLTHVGNGVWTGTWHPVNPSPGTLTISVTAFYSTGSVLQSGQQSLSGTLTAGATPTVTAAGVVHAASNAAGVPIAPGSLITIYGSNLADAQVQSSTLPLPNQQSGAQVLLGNLPLPILYTNTSQVNVQIPFNTPVNGQYQISVQRDNLLSIPEQLVIAPAQPGIFTSNQQGSGQGVIFKSDGVTLAQSGTPANAGETVVIYCTGLGAVKPPVPEGVAPPASPLSMTVNTVTVTIGGQDAAVQFSGLTPGFPGLYQVNAVVPPGVTGDAVPVVLTVADQPSPPVTMSVQ